MLYLRPVVQKLTTNTTIINNIKQFTSDEEYFNYLKKEGIIKSEIINALEKHYGFKYIDLANHKISQNVFNVLNRQELQRKFIIPYNSDASKNIIYFAIYDIMNTNLKNQIIRECRSNGYDVSFKFAFKNEIIDAYKALGTNYGSVVYDTHTEANSAIDWVDNAIKEAIRLDASDLHIECLEQGLQIRYRIDGILTKKQIFNYDKQIISAINVRIKVISSMDISEKRKPQDGRIDNYQYNNKAFDIRVSSVNTIHGEKFVLRIFNKSIETLTFEQIGFSDSDIDKIKKILQSQNGVIYMAGSTGSGKTTTLYTMIDAIKSDDINIYTIEDPVEKTIHSVNQIQIDPVGGVNYANTLKSLLRQDPDVIVVGEIRDSETADLSLQASLTGHLVLSTLHANGAIDTINRLLEMNLEPYLISASSVGFLSQRLVRKLCPHCKVKANTLSTNEDIWLKKIESEYGFKIDNESVYRPSGCNKCTNGYKGRTAVIEILEGTPGIKRLIAKQADIEDIKNQAIKDNFRPLIINGLEKVENGITSIEEIMRQI